MALAQEVDREQVVAGFLRVLFEQGIDKIPQQYRKPVLVEFKRLLSHPLDGFLFFWVNLAWIHIKGRGEGKGWHRACPDGLPRVVGKTGKDWSWQLDVARIITRYPMLLALKARQIGWTYLIANFVIWAACSEKEQIIAVVANKMQGSKRIMRRAREVYNRLPEWFRAEYPLINPALSHLEFANGSFIEPYSGDPNAARGDAATYLVADEIGEFEYLEDWYSAIESVAEHKIFFGTAKFNGLEKWVEDAAAGNIVETLLLETPNGTIEMPVWDNGLNDMTFAFFPWMVHPEHDSDWMEKRRRNYRGNLRNLEREHPSTWQEAFQASGKMYYNAEALEKQIHIVRGLFEKRDRRGTLIPTAGDLKDPKFVEDSYGNVVIHSTPDEFAELLELRRPFSLGADAAGDKRSGDYHAASGLQIGKVPEPGILEFDVDAVIPHRQLLTIHGYMDGDAYAELLFMAGFMLGQATIAVETTGGYGANIIKVLRRLRYPNLYLRRTSAKKKGEQVTKEYGWHTNQETKHIAYGEVERLLRNGWIDIRDPDTLAEMGIVQSLGAGKLGAREPGHDDRSDGLAIACAVAQYARHYAGRTLSPTRKGPAYGTLDWLLQQMDDAKEVKGTLGSEMAGVAE